MQSANYDCGKHNAVTLWAECFFTKICQSNVKNKKDLPIVGTLDASGVVHVTERQTNKQTNKMIM